MNDKPKLTVYTALRKSMILWGILSDIEKSKEKIRVYYVWDLKKRKSPVRTPCFVVDYDKYKREWNTFYYSDEEILSCTIDDITGIGSIKSSKN